MLPKKNRNNYQMKDQQRSNKLVYEHYKLEVYYRKKAFWPPKKADLSTGSFASVCSCHYRIFFHDFESLISPINCKLIIVQKNVNITHLSSLSHVINVCKLTLECEVVQFSLWCFHLVISREAFKVELA